MDVVRPSPGLLEIELASEDDTVRLGRAIADVVARGTVIGLVGPLGAGKTRLVRAIAEALGVEPNAISSPTFVLIQEYDGRLPVFHFDTYRLPSPAAFEDLGPADYWDAGSRSSNGPTVSPACCLRGAGRSRSSRQGRRAAGPASSCRRIRQRGSPCRVGTAHSTHLTPRTPRPRFSRVSLRAGAVAPRSAASGAHQGARRRS